LQGEQLLFLGVDARQMEEEFIAQQWEGSLMKDTFKYIHPHTRCRGGFSASLHRRRVADAVQEYMVLNGLRTLSPVEIFGGRHMEEGKEKHNGNLMKER
jgi:hypothetical protein